MIRHLSSLLQAAAILASAVLALLVPAHPTAAQAAPDPVVIAVDARGVIDSRLQDARVPWPLVVNVYAPNDTALQIENGAPFAMSVTRVTSTAAQSRLEKNAPAILSESVLGVSWNIPKAQENKGGLTPQEFKIPARELERVLQHSGGLLHLQFAEVIDGATRPLEQRDAYILLTRSAPQAQQATAPAMLSATSTVPQTERQSPLVTLTGPDAAPLPPPRSGPPGLAVAGERLPPDAPSGQIEPAYSVTIPINDTGIADWSYLNPRLAPYLFALPTKEVTLDALTKRNADERAIGNNDPGYPGARHAAAFAGIVGDQSGLLTSDAHALQRAEYAMHLHLVFKNNSFGRTFTVAFKIPVPGELSLPVTEQAKTDFERKYNVSLGTCTGGATGTCGVVVTVTPQAPATFPARLFLGGVTFDSIVPPDAGDKSRPDTERFMNALTYGATEPVEFRVSFFDEEGDPGQSRGYFSISRVAVEASSKATWSLATSIGGNISPIFPSGDTYLTAAAPWQKEYKSHFPFMARLDLTQTLNTRANALLSLQLRQGDLGDADQTPKVTASKLQVNVFGLNGAVLSFGRFDVAAPAGGIAARESGDTIRLTWRNLGVSHLVRRESATGVADKSNGDSKVTIVEANNLPGVLPAIRRVNLYLSHGRERTTGDNKLRHWATTAGLENFFASPAAPLQGSVAYFYSRRRPLDDVAGSTLVGTLPIAGDGHVALFSATYAAYADRHTKDRAKRPLNWLFGGQIGIGRGDDDETPDQDEGFLGTTMAFAPDTIFLKSLVARLQDAAFKERHTGLQDKLYVAASYTDNRVSLLSVVPLMLKIPPSDIESQATILKIEHYGFDRALLNGRLGGQELSMESQIQTPRGVKAFLKLAVFLPASEIKALLDRKRPWSILSGLSVTLQ